MKINMQIEKSIFLSDVSTGRRTRGHPGTGNHTGRRRQIQRRGCAATGIMEICQCRVSGEIGDPDLREDFHYARSGD